MVNTSIEGRLNRPGVPLSDDLLTTQGKSEESKYTPKSHKTDGPAAATIALIGLIFLPAGVFARMMTNILFEPNFGPHLAHYNTLTSAVMAFHLVFIGLMIYAVMTRFRRPYVTWVLLFTFGGYGVMGSLLSMTLG